MPDDNRWLQYSTQSIAVNQEGFGVVAPIIL